LTRDHYMLLQMSSTKVCHALLRFSDKRSSLAPGGSDSSQSMSQRLIIKYGDISTQPSMKHNL
jgi:hypothetical protein